MTEPLGVVASGIAVAQLGVATGGAVLKLRQLWGQVKDAPETISDLIERIDLIYPSVWDFEQQFAHSELPPMLWDRTTAVRSLAYCQKALMKLSGVVDGLSAKITSRRGLQLKLVAVKVVLKKDELKKLEEQLRNALDILKFAQDAYTRWVERIICDLWLLTINRALLTATPDIVALRLQQSRESCLPSTMQCAEAETSFSDIREEEDEKALIPTNSKIAHPVHRRSTSRWRPASAYGSLSVRRGPNEFHAEFRPPWWLAGLASSLTFHMSTYRSAWDVQVRLYTERSRKDSVFLMAEDGDVAGLRSLFELRKASPFDRDENGWTLFHVSLYTNSNAHENSNKCVSDKMSVLSTLTLNLSSMRWHLATWRSLNCSLRRA